MATIAVRPKASCSALAGSITTIVVQFGLATMPLRCVVERLGVDLADDQRDVGVHAPGRRVVDDDGAGRGEAPRPLPRGRAAGARTAPGRSPVTVSSVERLDRAVAGQLAARRALDANGTISSAGEAAALERAAA